MCQLYASSQLYANTPQTMSAKQQKATAETEQHPMYSNSLITYLLYACQPNTKIGITARIQSDILHGVKPVSDKISADVISRAGLSILAALCKQKFGD